MCIRLPAYLFVALVLSGCKVSITVPEGGRVESVSGAYTCEAGETCVIDVVDVFFDETFQAIPDPGYTFTAWSQKDVGLCGGGKDPCQISTTGWSGTPLEQFLERDAETYLDPVFGKSNTWVDGADLSMPSVAFATCSIGGKVQAVGLGWFGVTPDKVAEFDPETGDWTSRANMPTARAWLTATSVGHECFVIGGGVSGAPLTTVEAFSPRLNSWEIKAPLPGPRSAMGSATVNGKVYVIGGSSVFAWDSPTVAEVAIYDPATDQWSIGADMPTPRMGVGVAAIGDYIYAVGGSNYALGLQSSNIVERYDTVKDEWTTLASMPEKRNFVAVSVVHGYLYAIGGLIDGGDNTSNSVFRYDPKTNSWSTRKVMSRSRYAPGSVSLNGQIYVVGGRELRESPPLTATEVFTP
jgi:N-acetylneuraminic acid mutarotase